MLRLWLLVVAFSPTLVAAGDDLRIGKSVRLRPPAGEEWVLDRHARNDIRFRRPAAPGVVASLAQVSVFQASSLPEDFESQAKAGIETVANQQKIVSVQLSEEKIPRAGYRCLKQSVIHERGTWMPRKWQDRQLICRSDDSLEEGFFATFSYERREPDETTDREADQFLLHVVIERLRERKE